jgi:nucleoside-diphosphate-sugar epimerase
VEHALVSGGAGFIGSHLCAALLSRGAAVTCVDNLSTGRLENIEALLKLPRFSLLQLDVAGLDISSWLDDCANAPSHVFHLASPASVVDYLRMPLETMLVNSQGTWKLLELSRALGCKFVYTSTSEIYGDPLIHPQSEEYWGNVSPNGPRSCYDESKRFGEALVMQHWRSYGLDARIVRIFNTYGPHSRLDDGRVVPNFIGQALSGRPITIYGTGNQTRSFCFVSDLVEGLLATMFADGLAGEVFNLGNPEEYTITEFAEIVAELVAETNGHAWKHNHQALEWLDLPQDDPTRRRPNIDKARQRLAWEPKVSLRDGLRRTITWFRDRQQVALSAPTGVAHGSARAE